MRNVLGFLERVGPDWQLRPTDPVLVSMLSRAEIATGLHLAREAADRDLDADEDEDEDEDEDLDDDEDLDEDDFDDDDDDDDDDDEDEDEDLDDADD